MSLPTIKVADDALESGFRIINASDFDPARHVEFGAEPASQRDEDKPLGKAEARAALEAAGVEIPKNTTVAQMRDMLAELE